MFDVLVGINLLREGLDLPEVSLVAILDADKEGFLRSGTSLIQTIGRAARNVSGEVHMYASSVTKSMAHAIEETERRRERQLAYNAENTGLIPHPFGRKSPTSPPFSPERKLTRRSWSRRLQGKPVKDSFALRLVKSGPDELSGLIATLTDQMMQASAELKFELAAKIRDEVLDLKRELREMVGAQG